MEQGLLEKTGKSLEHWVAVIKASQLEKHKAMIDFLKAEHGLTYGYANFVAMKARKADAASHDADDLVTAQYQGKENLQPIYAALITEIQKFGDDITQTPKKAAVSLIRKHQFALIKPATKKRIDLGLKLKGTAPEGRLEPSGPFGSMCTHRIQLMAVQDVDAEVLGWIKAAYEQSV